MKPSISCIQGILLIMSTIAPTAILSVPNTMALFSKQDAWISVVLATGTGMVFALLIGAICKLNPGMTFLEWLESRTGAAVRMFTGILLTLYYLIILAFIMREFINYLLVNVLNTTPDYILLLITGTVVAYAAGQGIDTIARINFIVVGVTSVIFIVTIALLVEHIHFNRLLPLGENPLNRIVYGAVTPVGWLTEVAVLLLIVPYLKHSAHATKIALWGVALVGVEILIIVTASISIFGPELTARLSYPTFSLIGIIEISRFLERIDILFISVWICNMYVKMAVFLFGAFHCFVQTFRIRIDKPFLPVIALFSIINSYLHWPKTSDVIHFQSYVLIPFLLACNVLLPLIVWICAKAAGKSAMEKRG